jgi:hypothetical protein
MSTTTVQPVITPAQQIEITNYVNAYRAKNQAPPLVWDNTIASFAQQWSYYLASNNLFQHSGTNLYGENLAYFKGYGSDVMSLMKLSIDDWYNEISLYDFNNPAFSASTGHFTCLVWLTSTTFGMGISINNANNTVDVTFNTSPPGNYIGEFQQNVLPPLNPLPSPTPVILPPVILPPVIPPPVILPPVILPPVISPPVISQIIDPIHKTIILNQLKSLILAIQNRQPIQIILNASNLIINNINAYINSSIKSDYVQAITFIVTSIKRKVYPSVITGYINKLAIAINAL